jgi:hypothetical protein
MDDFFFYSDNELCEKLTDWLFVECLNEFRATTERVLQLENDGKYAARIYGKEKLSSLLDLPVSDLELQLMLSEDQFRTDINVAEGPHYYVPVPDLTELQMCKREDSGDSFAVEQLTPPARSATTGFDLLDTVFQDYGDTELNNKISDIKIELNEFCAGEGLMSGYEERVEMGCGECDELETMPKLQIISKHKGRESEHEHEHACPTTVRQQKKRGRPRK